MKTFFTHFLILISVFLAACGPQKPVQQPQSDRPTPSGNIKTETRQVGGFRAVHIGGNIIADITVGGSSSVTLEGDDNIVDLMKTEVENDVLRVELKQKLTRNIMVRVTITAPELSELEVISTSTADVKGVKGDSFVLRAIAGSKIVVAGEVNSLEAHAHGVSSVDAEALKVRTAEVEAVGGASVVVSPAASLKATTAGSATVIYTGDPKIEKNSSDTSTVRKKG